MSSKHQDYIAALNPVLWYKFDEPTGATFANSGSTGATNNITLAADPVRSGVSKALSKDFIDTGSNYASYGATPGSFTFGQNVTIAFWFKSPSISIYRMWMYGAGNASNAIDTTARSGFTSSGQIKLAPRLGNTNYPAVQSTTNVCNGAWHHIAFVREGGTTAKVYVNGVLEHTQTGWFSDNYTFSQWYPIHDSPNAMDEYVAFNTAFNAGAIADLYNSASPSAFDTRIATLTAPKFWFKMEGPNDKLFNYGSFLNANGLPFVSCNRVGPSAGVVSENTGGKSGGYFNFPYGNDETNGKAYFNLDPTSGSDDSAAIFNNNQSWTFEYFMKMPTVTHQNSNAHLMFRVNSSGSEAIYAFVNNTNGGDPGKLKYLMTGVSDTLTLTSTNRVDDNAWHHVAIVHTASTKTEMFIDGTLNVSLNHGGFGNQYKLNDRYSTINIGANSGSTSTESYLGALDDFLIYNYALTAQQISDNNASVISSTSVVPVAALMLANPATFVMPAISAIKNVNYSDTASTASALAVQPTIISDDEAIYSHTVATATADALDPTITTVKQVSAAADPGTASALAVDPTVTSDDEAVYSTGPLTASALIVDPVVSTITNASISADPGTASALIVHPVIEAVANVAYIADPATADAYLHMPGISIGDGHIAVHLEASALFVMPTIVVDISINISAAPSTASALAVQPTITTIRSVSYSAAVTTASAISVMPNVGVTEDNPGTPITASALFVMPVILAVRNRTYLADPFTSSALAVQPALTTQTLGAILVKPFKASAFIAEPPAYFSLNNDKWYQKLVDVDNQSPFAIGNITFFNTSNNIYLGGTFGVWKAENRVYGSYGNVATYNDFTTPVEPVAYAGYYDGQNRKALNLKNIILTTGYINGNIGAGSKDFTLEAMIRTTKDTQVLFVGENSNSYNFQRTGIILKNGKLALTESKDSRLGRVLTSDQIAFIGNKNIADGEWHHIVIQSRNNGIDESTSRLQFWIDGELDIQRFGYFMYKVNQVGYNSYDVNSFSDFYISAVSINEGSMVERREININYLAAFNITPIEASVATASVTFTPDNKGRGNRGRALMLYFWPTFNAENGYYKPYQRYMGGNIGVGSTPNDQGTYGYDPDTFYQLTTFIKNGANKFYDWDMWPLAVTAPPTGDTFPGNTHPLLKDGVMRDGGYKDPITDNYRYLNLMEDLKDLSQFDMICFRNYPDDSGERDIYGTNSKGINDSYFGTLNKDLFEVFLKSLRDAVDSGISLFITNPQLAIDMGFIDTYHTVDALNGYGNELGSDPFVPIKLNDPLNTGAPVLNLNYETAITTSGDRTNSFKDYYRNNYHEVVNTLYGLTDDPAYIWKDEVYYKPDGLEYGELDRIWSRIEYNPGLQPGDKFLISCMINAGAFHAIPLDAVKAGKVITKFAETYMHGTVERVNPYRNYATSIAVEPGTVVAGKQIGAKVFISFTDNPGIQQSLTPSYLAPGSNVSVEVRSVELNTNYWIDYAFTTGSITSEERDFYRSRTTNIDNIYPNGGPVANALKYWTLNGANIVGSRTSFGDTGSDIGLDTSESVKKGKAVAKTRAGMRRRNTVSTSSMPSYSVSSGWVNPLLSVPIPSINTRGLWWLSERLEYTGGLPKSRPLAVEADAFMPQPVVTGFKVGLVNAQAAIASATIVETSLRSGDVVIASLPLTATAFLPERGTFIAAEPAVAQARLTTNFRTITSADDDVVLYIMHEDPILYIREDAIK